MKHEPKTKRKQLSFDEWYAIAKQYYEEHGDLLVPRNYEDAEGHKLGRWIERQRAFYNGSPNVTVSVTQTDIAMLNKIGMVWKLGNRFPWPEWLLQCKLYHAVNGDLLVPKSYKNEKYALGNWIGEQRRAYKKGTLSTEKIEALEQYGMVWELVDRDVWEKRYNDAHAYYKKHGDLDVPPNMLTAGNCSLREWLTYQKSIYQEENCKTDTDWTRHDLLDDIGINWERVRGSTLFSYNSVAKKYFEDHGDLNVSEDYVDPKGIDLYHWVKRQWVLYHRPATARCKSYQIRKKELKEIGFDWSCEGRWDWDSKELDWYRNFCAVKKYVDNYAKLPLGAAAIPIPTVVNSEIWIRAQRVAICNNLMNEDKQEMLAEIGIVYGQQEATWQENYEFIKAYVEKHHSLPTGKNSIKMKNGCQTGPWIANQKIRIRNGVISKEREALLRGIGIGCLPAEGNS